MKKLMTFIALATSFSALSADISFFRKVENHECVIKNNKVTRKMVFGGGKIGFTETSTIESFGIEAVAQKAAELSTGRTTPIMNIATTVTIDGVTSTLHTEDSPEARHLIVFMSAACK